MTTSERSPALGLKLDEMAYVFTQWGYELHIVCSFVLIITPQTEINTPYCG